MTTINFHGYFETDKTIEELNQLSDFEMYKEFIFAKAQNRTFINSTAIPEEYDNPRNTIY